MTISKCCAKAASKPSCGVVVEDVLARGQQPLHHGVLLGHPLHDGVRREPREERRDHRQRHVGADGEVVDEGEGEDDVGVCCARAGRAAPRSPTPARGSGR